jgi:Na+/H+-dicarboxylate symporter
MNPSFQQQQQIINLKIEKIGFITIPLIYLAITRKNIFIYAKNMLEAIVIALATASR